VTEPTTSEPTLRDEQQLEVHPAVAVSIVGPVRTQSLPPVMSVIRELTLPASMAAPIVAANHDLRRKRLQIFAPTTGTPALFTLAFTSTDAGANIGTWIQNEKWEHFGEEQVWANNPNAADIILTILEEFYTQ
jgi:hypothetical protein